MPNQRMHSTNNSRGLLLLASDPNRQSKDLGEEQMATGRSLQLTKQVGEYFVAPKSEGLLCSWEQDKPPIDQGD
jgi:hypothetical protein